MGRKQSSVSWRLEAIAGQGDGELPEQARSAFDSASEQLQQPGLFEGAAVTVDGQAFSELTGFHPQPGEVISVTAVRRAAEAATSDRTKALANCRGAFRADYVTLGVFLRVCAVNALRLRAEVPAGRRRHG